MSDGSRVFKDLKKSLSKLFPKMTGHEASHFSTLLHIITGMIVSKHSHLPKIAGKLQSKAKQESIVKKIKRWLSNKSVNGNLFFLPFLERLLPYLITDSVKLLIDGSVVGRDSACLMVSLVYKNRAIPIAWLMAEGRKGHFNEAYHLEILTIVKSVLPDDIRVTLIGDGEFDGVDFLEAIDEYGWHFVIRIAKNAVIHKNGERIKLPTKIKPGCCELISNVEFSGEGYGPLTVVSWKPKNKSELLHLISNHKTKLNITKCYQARQKIETFFSDLKTRGFHLQKSHISNLARLGNLMLAACIGYIWVVLLGKYALNIGVNTLFHRTDRCDLSLFQIGFRYIEYLINNNIPIPKINFMDLG